MDLYKYIFFIIILLGFIVIREKKREAKAQVFMNDDSRLKGGVIHSFSSGNFVMINENGFIGLKNSKMDIPRVVHINDINGFEIINNGKSVANVSGAIIGGLIFGGIGALIGGIGSSKQKIISLRLIFKINDFDDPIVYIDILPKTSTTSHIYKFFTERMELMLSRLEILEKKYKKLNNK